MSCDECMTVKKAKNTFPIKWYSFEDSQVFTCKMSFDGKWKSGEIIHAIFHPGGKYIETVVEICKGQF